MNKKLKDKLLSKEKWLRAFFMIIYLACKCIAWWIVLITIIFQFLTDFITGKPNARVLEFSNNLNTYVFQLLNYLTFNSDIKPFPFSNWPGTKKE
jgi:hypothetical protein